MKRLITILAAALEARFSWPTAMILPELRMNMITIVGRMPGMSICQTRWNLFAPSITAASCSSGLSEESAARYRMLPQPADCQISDPIYSGRNQEASPMKWIRSMPSNSRMWLTMPDFRAKNRVMIPTMTTVEMKCGA